MNESTAIYQNDDIDYENIMSLDINNGSIKRRRTESMSSIDSAAENINPNTVLNP